MNNKLCEENDQNSLTTKLLYKMWELAVLFGRGGWGGVMVHSICALKEWDGIQNCRCVILGNKCHAVTEHSTWSPVRRVHCEPPRWMIGIQVFRTDWALTVLVSLQLTQSWRWRAWPLNASCNWVNLLQFSSVQFSSCAVNCPLENSTTERSAVHESTDDLFSSSVSDKSHYFTI